MNKKQFEGIALDVAYAFDYDLDEVMKAYEDGEVRVFTSIDEGFNYIFIEHDDIHGLSSTMETMSNVTADEIENSECDNVGEYMLLTHSNTKFVNDNLWVFIYE